MLAKATEPECPVMVGELTNNVVSNCTHSVSLVVAIYVIRLLVTRLLSPHCHHHPSPQKKDNCLFLAHELMHDLTEFPVAIQTRETDSRRFFFREHPEPLTILRRYATAKMGVSQGAATLCEKCQNYKKKRKRYQRDVYKVVLLTILKKCAYESNLR